MAYGIQIRLLWGIGCHCRELRVLTRPYKFRLQTPKPCIQEAPVQVLRSSFMQVQHEALRWMFAPSGGALNNTHLLNPYYCCHPIFGRFTLIVLHEVNVITLCSKRTDRPNPLDPPNLHPQRHKARAPPAVCTVLLLGKSALPVPAPGQNGDFSKPGLPCLRVHCRYGLFHKA